MEHTKNILGPQDSALHKNGKEVHSPKPAHPLTDMSGKDYEMDRIKQMVRGEMSKVAQEHGMETFEEANDFDVDEPFDAFENIETKYMQPEYPGENTLPPRQPEAPEDSPLTKNGESGATEPKEAPEGDSQ